MMTAKKLIERLSTVPPDTPVVMSKDGEGNGFSPLAEADTAARYVEETTWAGDVLHPDDYDAYDPESMTHVVCLWPVN